METRHDKPSNLSTGVPPFSWGVLSGNYELAPHPKEGQERTGMEEDMRHQDFDAFLEEVQTEERKILVAKNEEYAPGGDKLANFKKGAKALCCTPEECLWGYAMKHIISIQDIVQSESGYTPEKMREKCVDLRAYLVLLEALMIERHT